MERFEEFFIQKWMILLYLGCSSNCLKGRINSKVFLMMNCRAFPWLKVVFFVSILFSALPALVSKISI